MSESAPVPRRRWQVRVWALLLVPVACAPAFYYLAMRNRVSPAERVERRWNWVRNALKYPFSPQDGERVEPGDMLVIVAGVRYKGDWDSYIASSRWLMPDGMVHYAVNSGSDEWGGHGLIRADRLAQLPGQVRALPPSDPNAPPTNRVIVAFPDKGRWVVRAYRLDAAPREFKELEKALKVPTQ